MVVVRFLIVMPLRTNKFVVFPGSLLEHFAIGGVAGALAMAIAVLEFPDVFAPVGKGEGALAVPFVVPEFTDVVVSIGKGVGALAVAEVVPIFPDVFAPVGIGVGALAVVHAVLVFPDVFLPVGKGVGALAVHCVVLPFPDVFVPVGKGEGALAVHCVVPEFPDVFGPVGIGVGAEAVVITQILIFGTWGQGLGKGSAWGAQQPDGGKSYENKGSDPLHTGRPTPTSVATAFLLGPPRARQTLRFGDLRGGHILGDRGTVPNGVLEPLLCS